MCHNRDIEYTLMYIGYKCVGYECAIIYRYIEYTLMYKSYECISYECVIIGTLNIMNIHSCIS